MRHTLVEERLMAAYQASGFVSWQQLGDAAGIAHPILSRVRARSRKVVNSRTLHRLSTVLNVPSDWLTGRQVSLPYVARRGLIADAGDRDLWDRPTADAVRYSALMRRVVGALQRDLSTWDPATESQALDLWGRGLLEVFDELLSAFAVRSAVLIPIGDPIVLLMSRGRPSTNEENFRWVLHTFEPWFDGHAFLNAEALLGVLKALYASPRRIGAPLLDEMALSSLVRYSAALKDFRKLKESPGAGGGGSRPRSKARVKQRPI